MEEHTLTVPGLLEEAQRLQQELREERDRLRLLLEVNNLLVSRLQYPELLEAFRIAGAGGQARLGERGAFRSVYWAVRLQALTYTDARGGRAEHHADTRRTPAGVIFQTGVATVFRKDDLERLQGRSAAAPPVAAVVLQRAAGDTERHTRHAESGSADPEAFVPAKSKC